MSTQVQEKPQHILPFTEEDYLAPTGERIVADRYLLKDTLKETLGVDSVVVAVLDKKRAYHELAKVVEIDKENKKVKIELRDGFQQELPMDQVDVLKETAPRQMWERIANGVASAVHNPEYWKAKFYDLQSNWKYVAGGRINASMGTGVKTTSYNCFVIPNVESQPRDYANSFAQSLEIQARSGGVGMNLSQVPPEGTLTPIREVRKTDLQLVLDVWHGDLLDFLDEKYLNSTKVVLLDEEFLDAVNENKDWTFVFPDTTADGYDDIWNGDIQDWIGRSQRLTEGETVNAKELYDKILRSDATIVNDLIGTVLHAGDRRATIASTLADMWEEMMDGERVSVVLSSLRPRYSYVRGVNGRSSGAYSWGHLYDKGNQVFANGFGPVGVGEIMSVGCQLTLQGGCVAPYSQIMTNKGLVSAEELFHSKEEILVSTHHGYKKVTHKFDNGAKHVCRIQTEYGYELDASDDHKFLVMDNKGNTSLIPLDEIHEGDSVFVLLNKSGLQNKDYVVLDNKYKEVTKMTTNKKGVTLPNVLEEKLAFVIGYYDANGSRIKSDEFEKGITFSVPDDRPEVIDKLVDYIRDVFDCSVSVHSGDGNCSSLNVYSVDVVEFLRNNNLLKRSSSDLEVPKQIFKSPTGVVENYIGGFFAGDGCNKGKKGGLTICTVSKKFAKQYQKLLLQFGIPSKLTTEKSENENWKEKYVVSVTSNIYSTHFAEILRDHTSKVDDHELAKKNMSYSIPVNLYNRFKYVSGFGRKCASNANNTSIEAIRFLNENKSILKDEDKDFVNLLFNSVVDRVASIVSIGEMNVYDFEVEDVHMLSFDGLYTSNSRRGALMLILNDKHADIKKFVTCKQQDGVITGANLSVGVSEEFMETKAKGELWELGFPVENDTMKFNGDFQEWEQLGGYLNVSEVVKAEELWDLMMESAWKSAEPGVVFLGRYNYMSNSRYFNPIIATNPCGEQGLPAYGICNLGAVALNKFVNSFKDSGKKSVFTNKKLEQKIHNELLKHFDQETSDFLLNHIKWEELEDATRTGLRFQDAVIDATYYPFEENHINQMNERRVGLGFMGLHDLMLYCGIKYGSDESTSLIDVLGGMMAEWCYLESVELAKENGAFPKFDAEQYLQSGYMQIMAQEKPHVTNAIREHGVRNVTTMTIAPTGTTGTMVGCSTGCEPYYAWTYFRNSRLGLFEEKAAIVAEYFEAHPNETELPEYFVTAMDLTPTEHITVQAALQKWIDSSISKTCNAPNSYTVEDTKKLYDLAYELGAKGVTIYRDGSRSEQVLSLKDDSDKTDSGGNLILGDTIKADRITNESNEFTKKNRPDVLYGATYKKQTPLGTTYITVNDQDGIAREIFVNVGKAGSDAYASNEAIGRVATLYLSESNNPDKEAKLVKHLSGIGGGDPVGFGERRITSVPDAIAKALIEHSETFPLRNGILIDIENSEVLEEQQQSENKKSLRDYNVSRDFCPNCQQHSLVKHGGCSECEACGFSKC